MKQPFRKRSLGQSFLSDHNILRKEVALASVNGTVVLEIGGGDGRLTEKILDKSPKHLYVVEKDHRFSELLKQKFIDIENIEILSADFLDLDLQSLNPQIIIGNIPYNISSKIIFSLKDLNFERAVLMVQKEFAEKMVAKPNDGNYGRLSVTSQLFFTVQFVQKVPRHLFSPSPRVDSAIIILTKNTFAVDGFAEEVINKLFQHRNKTVKNALSGYNINNLNEFINRRVRTLSKEDCLKITDLLRPEKSYPETRMISRLNLY
ncbi:ribosomal RNA small subunit methyltransferase A [Candidatus Micrarchaeota archaeon]|nr:ribosomal RNA small subunit methyltransferase A [Candidatus Micrarchaeota archaeon]